MKYLNTFIGIGFSLLCFIFIRNVSGSQAADSYTERFAFVAPISWNKVAYGIAAADRDFGTNTILVGSKSLNEEGMIRELERAITTGVDGIITAGVFSSPELYEVIEQAQNMGIPVVILDSDLPESARSAYVGTDNYQAGVAAARDLIEATEGSAQIGVIVSERTAANQQQRLEGLYDTLKDSPDMQVVEVAECHSDYLEIADKLSAMLEEYPEIDALCFLEGRAGSCAGRIVQDRVSAGRKLTVVAFDTTTTTLSYVEDGTYFSTIAQKQYEEGYLAVELLSGIVEGIPQEETVVMGVESLRQETAGSAQITQEELVWHYY